MTNEQEILIQQWQEAKAKAEEAKLAIDAEMELRKKVFAVVFPTPTEGTNKLELGAGYVLKGAYKIERKVDDAALGPVMKELRDMGVNADILVDWKPSVKISTYRECSTEVQRVFDRALIIKPASPTLELVEPKKKG